MASLNWCFKKRDVSLVEPNENLSKEYIKSSEESLEILKKIEGISNMWVATAKYYCKYHAVYAVLMKIGIKSEIHDCTIKIAEFLEKQGILKKGTAYFLKKDKDLRIDNQYYLKNKKIEFSYDEILRFVLETKETLDGLTSEKIDGIRSEIDRLISKDFKK